MSATGVGFVPDSFRWSSGSAPASETALIVCATVVMALACALVLYHQRRRRARHAEPVGDQWQALAVMGELCPDGWQAQITLQGSSPPELAEARSSRGRDGLVELEWTQFVGTPRALPSNATSPLRRSAARCRRWSRTGALDMALEQIERAAGDG